MLYKRFFLAFIFITSAIFIAEAQISAIQTEHLNRAWPNTDLGRAGVDLGDVIAGGPPKDGIPAITAPAFITLAEETRLHNREPVIAFIPSDGMARAYPIRYLIWHEIVNDTVSDMPIAVTFCPLCNTAIIFDPVVDGVALEFGVSGLLRFSDMIMYDRQTESWWQQAVGEGIAGKYLGARLTQLPARMLSWQAFKTNYPNGIVMDEPNWSRRYGTNPYQYYDTSHPFLYRGETPPFGINPLERVVRVDNRAWPLNRLRKAGRIAEADVVITWGAGQASALDTNVLGEGREIGNIRVQDLTGLDVVHDIPFAFAFHAFHPEGVWMLEN
ncbi:MAG: DUF3179 domain-containing protein [Candidatus Puniceispirillales bacterium WSBS_2018_MAG_OTU23]